MLTRLVARDDTMPEDALLWGGATCWKCPRELAKVLDVNVQERCAVDLETCVQGPDSEWFRIVLCDSDTEFNFCPRHALAAEALGSLACTAQQVVDILRRLDTQSAPLAIQFTDDDGKSQTEHEYRVVKLHG